MSYILETNDLTKIIDGKEIVKKVNIHVKKGEIYGFLGPNGAGKTSVLKMALNLWKPTKGVVELFGKPLTPKSYEVLRRVGSIIEFPVFYDHLSGRENLNLHCEYMGYYHAGSVEKSLEMLELTGAADKPARTYSLGMKQRLGIARAILTGPELLLLDEPTNGLDPAGMKHLRDLFKRLCTEYGVTMMISSHILSEVENIADTIGIINHGTLVKEISMKEISEMNTAYIEITADDMKAAAYVLADKLGIQQFKIVDDRTARIYDTSVKTSDLSKAFAQNGVEIDAVGRKSENLEDYFLKLTEGEGKSCLN